MRVIQSTTWEVVVGPDSCVEYSLSIASSMELLTPLVGIQPIFLFLVVFVMELLLTFLNSCFLYTDWMNRRFSLLLIILYIIHGLNAWYVHTVISALFVASLIRPVEISLPCPPPTSIQPIKDVVWGRKRSASEFIGSALVKQSRLESLSADILSKKAAHVGTVIGFCDEVLRMFDELVFQTCNKSDQHRSFLLLDCWIPWKSR